MNTADAISLCALFVSLSAFLVTFFVNRKLASESARRDDAMSHYARAIDYLGEVGDRPTALALYGVDLEALEKAEVTTDQVAYLVRYLVAIEAKIQYDDETIREHLARCPYCRHMLNQPITRAAFEFARNLIGPDVGEGIASYLAETAQDADEAGPLPAGGSLGEPPVVISEAETLARAD